MKKTSNTRGEKRKRGSHTPGAGIVKELAGGREDDERNLSIAENRKLLSFLKKPSSPLGESHLPGRNIIDLPDLDLLSRHSPHNSTVPPLNPIHILHINTKYTHKMPPREKKTHGPISPTASHSKIYP